MVNVPLRLLSSLLMAVPLVTAAGVQASPSSTTPGGQVTVTGSGFDCATPDLPSRAVEVYATGPSSDPANRPAPVQVEPDQFGYFRATLIFPPTAPSGEYTVAAWCAAGTHDGPGITTKVTVTAPPEELRLSPGSVAAGGSVTATGSGFVKCAAAGARVAIRFEDATGTALTDTAVTAAGTFSASFRVPAGTPPAGYGVAAECTATETGEYASAPLTVTAAPRTTTPGPTTPRTASPDTGTPETGTPGTGQGSSGTPGGPGTYTEGPDPSGLLVLLAVVAALVGGAVLVRKLLRGRPGKSPGPPPVIHASAGPPEPGTTRLRTGPGRALAIRVLARSEPGETRVRGSGGEWSE
ncbi:hypothetical protein GCM10023321_21730 [Pseudonocardia eucalypti]|uniref:IPT/TIG domain-containing protein n=1 Tax=Pseudonocardia eucalypti TaxID=648755 RepID=A0ABP9PXH0_9PSEU